MAIRNSIVGAVQSKVANGGVSIAITGGGAEHYGEW